MRAWPAQGHPKAPTTQPATITVGVAGRSLSLLDPRWHDGPVLTSPALLALLAVLATARLTTLLNDDVVAAPVRAWAGRRGDTAAYFVGCPWCVSIYTGAAVAAATYAWHAYWPVQVGLLLLTASYLTGLLAELRSMVQVYADAREAGQ